MRPNPIRPAAFGLQRSHIGERAADLPGDQTRDILNVGIVLTMRIETQNQPAERRLSCSARNGHDSRLGWRLLPGARWIGQARRKSQRTTTRRRIRFIERPWVIKK